MPRSIHENPQMMANLEKMANQNADPIARDIAKKKLEHARGGQPFFHESMQGQTPPPPPPPEMPSNPSWDNVNSTDTSPMRDLVNRVYKPSSRAHQRYRPTDK